ncbi:MAG TPA: C25 family peptidase propeptide domain-containing protein, partial [Candidatus Cloacimonas sp.]|nr:C25 family peptidase propeptide domain-containing protein [Candidatus Cloacimonas sp.]HNS84352.1 C25 family peptidase propeptide domain-containing protein [Candidatus Cloacimonas sp.]
MKKISFILLLVFTTAILMAASGTIKLQDNPAKVQLLEKSDTGLSIVYAVDELQFKEINTKEGIFTELTAANYTTTNVTGLPALPLMRQLISVPLGANVTAKIMTCSSRSINLDEQGVLYPLMPR